MGDGGDDNIAKAAAIKQLLAGLQKEGSKVRARKGDGRGGEKKLDWPEAGARAPVAEGRAWKPDDGKEDEEAERRRKKKQADSQKKEGSDDKKVRAGKEGPMKKLKRASGEGRGQKGGDDGVDKQRKSKSWLLLAKPEAGSAWGSKQAGWSGRPEVQGR